MHGPKYLFVHAEPVDLPKFDLAEKSIWLFPGVQVYHITRAASSDTCSFVGYMKGTPASHPQFLLFCARWY